MDWLFPAKSGRGLRHSKTLARALEPIRTPPGLGVRQTSGAFAEARGFPPLLVLGNTGAFEPDHLKPLLEQIQRESVAR